MIGVRPEGADGAAVHVIGGEIDPVWVREFSRAHESAGFDKVLVGYTSSAPEGFVVASLRGGAHRAARLSDRPPAGVRRADAGRAQGGHARPLQPAAGSRSTSSPAAATREQQRTATGSTTTPATGAPTSTSTMLRRVVDERPAVRPRRASSTASRRRFSEVKPLQKPHIPLYFGGASGPAVTVGAKHADVYTLWGEPIAAMQRADRRGARRRRAVGTRAALQRVAAADPRRDRRPRHGRRRATILERIGAREAGRRADAAACPQAVGARSGCSTSPREAEVHDKRLWTPIAAATGGARQHHRAGRHAGAGGGVAARLLRRSASPRS